LREPRELGDERLRKNLREDIITLCVTSSLDVPLPESGTGSHIVDVLLDVAWNVISFRGDIMSSRGVFPDIEFCKE
jgi:hypothetical protein